jgi:rhodanese-related sulfurtransferase
MAVGAEELGRHLDAGATVVDVRTTTEFRAGHVPGAINVPMDEIESRLDDLPQGRPVVLVCASGRRSELTRAQLGDRLPGAVCLEGGMGAWELAGRPVVRSTRTRIALDRQAMIGASVFVLTAVLLGTLVSPGWFYLALLPGFGLMLAGTTGICPMAVILSLMPWNKAR